MNKYQIIRDAIVSHLQANIDDAFITGDISASTNIQDYDTAIAVFFAGFEHLEDRSEPGHPSRDAEYWISVVCRASNDRNQSDAIDDRVSEIEDLCNAPGHGFPVFSVTGVERSTAVRANKNFDDAAGINATIVVTVRIHEDEIELVPDPRLTTLTFMAMAGLASCIQLQPNTIFDYYLPDGTVQSGVNSPVYTPAKGTGDKYIYAIMDDGHEVSELTHIAATNTLPTFMVYISDLIHMRPSTMFSLAYQAVVGDVDDLRNVVAPTTSRVYIHAGYNFSCLYGSVSRWVMQATEVLLYNCRRVYGSLQFATDAPTSKVTLSACTDMSADNVSQTIINYDNCNANVFARTFLVNTVKRSQLTASAETSVLSLIAKGCTFTFAPE